MSHFPHLKTTPLEVSVSAMATTLLRRCRRGQSFFLSSKKPAVLRRTIHTSVWWDFNSCEVPEGGDPSSIPGNITDALAKLNYGAPATFSVYGDWYCCPFFRENVEPLSKRGIKVKYVNSFRMSNAFPPFETNLGSKRILHDIWFWAKDHPAPANYLIISGDGDLSFALHQLRMRRYDILLAIPGTIKDLGPMEATAKAVWDWTSLVAGGPPQWTKH